MCRAFEETRKEGIELGEEKERIRVIKHLMDTMKITARQAMDMLGLPPAEQTKYMEKLN